MDTAPVPSAPAGPPPAPQRAAPPDTATPAPGAPPAAPEAARDRSTAPDTTDPELTVRNPLVEALTAGIRLPQQRGADQARAARFPRPDEADDADDADDQASKRVRVVLAERKGVARPVRTVVDIQEGTGVGELLRTNLIGSQLAVALRFAVVAGLSLGLLPLLFAMVPEIGRIEVLGLRLPWLLLGVLVYPFLFGLGLWHTRTAERVEQNFADHVQD